jgi:hypothetical protein
MIRPIAVSALFVAALLTYGLYSMKYEVQRLETGLAELARELAAEREAIHVLRAEWSYLNGPDRLETLAMRHLDLTTAPVRRVAAIATIPLRSSDPAAVDPASTPEGDRSTAKRKHTETRQ